MTVAPVTSWPQCNQGLGRVSARQHIYSVFKTQVTDKSERRDYRGAHQRSCKNVISLPTLVWVLNISTYKSSKSDLIRFGPIYHAPQVVLWHLSVSLCLSVSLSPLSLSLLHLCLLHLSLLHKAYTKIIRSLYNTIQSLYKANIMFACAKITQSSYKAYTKLYRC